VVNKAAGQVVHLSPGHPSETLVNALLHHRPALGYGDLDAERPGIVHRLDRDTSGLLVVATNPDALHSLQRAFARREVDKRYLALVYGHPMPHQAAIEAPIGRDPANRLRMTIMAEGGRYARTEYNVLETFREASFLEVNLLTGRTHQIRVHLASIGFPVVGDRTYGRRREIIAAPRQMLHAARLTLRHPDHGGEMTFEAPLPPDFAHILETLRSR
jgi:23S rRNA pseudouridine1911/1915/1917 synthase